MSGHFDLDTCRTCFKRTFACLCPEQAQHQPVLANHTQVGGQHYRTFFQHWDLAHALDLGYFEGQITKYTTRHRTKNGKQDLEKARHFAVKLKELLLHEGRQPRHKYPDADMLNRYGDANNLGKIERRIILNVCTWNTYSHRKYVIEDLDLLLAETDGSAPGPGYVNQDGPR